MPEPKQSTSPGQLPASPAAKARILLAEPNRGSVIPGEEKVRAALRDGDIKAMDEMGLRAKSVLFKIIEVTEEELPFRRMAADAATELYGNNINMHHLVLCLLLQGRVEDAASLKADPVPQVLGLLKSRKENAVVRNTAVDVLIRTQGGEAIDSTFTVVLGLSALLSNEQVVPIVRVKIAEEIPKLIRICDDNRRKTIKSALDKASRSGNSSVAFAAEDGIDAIKAIEQKEAEERSGECVDDQNPTLRLPRK